MKKLRYQVQKFKILDTYIHTIHSILTPKQLSHHFKQPFFSINFTVHSSQDYRHSWCLRTVVEGIVSELGRKRKTIEPNNSIIAKSMACNA